MSVAVKLVIGTVSVEDVAGMVKAVTLGGVITLAILQPDGAYEANPPEPRELRGGENLIASGSTDDLAALRARA